MNYKKNLIVFCPSIEEGGVEKNLINISNSLSKDLKISIITANNDKKKKFSKDIEFISTKKLNFTNKNRFLKGIVSAILLIKNFKKNCIILSFQSNIIAIVLSKFLNCKIIIRSNTSPSKYVDSFFKKILFKFFFKISNKIIVNSKEFNKEFYKYFNIRPVTIYNPIENISYLKKMSFKKANIKLFKNDKSLKILSIGRLVKQKDHMTILKAINNIKHKRKIKLFLIGKGDQKDLLKKYIKKNNLYKIIKLLGYKKNIYPYLKKADLFILSSKYEGLPNTLIEALSFGIPIFSTNCKTGPKEILNKSKYGTLFKVGDYKTLSNLILNFKKKKKVSFFNDKRFNYERIIRKYKIVINSI